MPDGLFTQRPSEPPPVDLDALVTEVMTFKHPEEGPNVAVPVTWTIVDREAPWPTLIIAGTYINPQQQPEPWTVKARIPRLRALPEEVRAQTEKACTAVARFVAERRRGGYTFEDTVVPARPLRRGKRARG